MSDITDVLDKVRVILDDDELSSMWKESMISHLFIDPLLDAIENGDGYMTFSSCCCSGHPPDRTFKVQFTMQPHGFTAKRCE